MPIEITMPALSPTMEEGNLAKWLVKEGDSVASGDVIAEIETDKATMEVEAVDEGVIAKIVVEGGTEGVKVNSVIAILAEEGEDVSEAAKSSVEVVAIPTVDNSTTEADTPTPHPELVEGQGVGGEGGANNAQPLRQAQGEGLSQSQTSPVTPSGARIFASPLARRIAKDAGVEITSVSGSGPHGRVIKRDVESAISGGTAKATGTKATQQATLPTGMSDEQTLKLFEEGSYELVPHDNMRKIIARRLIEAKSSIPHFYLTVECELDEMLKLRKQSNEAAPILKTDDGEKPAYKLSVNDFIIKALAMALQAVPEANVSWTDSHMIQHKHSDVGVAVSIPGGLITPIVRKAENKKLSEISNEMKDLAGRARNRKLKPDEYEGGSSAVSNLGMFGIREFSAIINPPHATILAVGAGEQRTIVKDGEIKIATIMSATMSTDHRAVDGALGAQLLGAFKKYIENPLGMLV